MKLEEIGFYTLSDDRAKNNSPSSPLWRCELLLTDACNFNCPYCKGVREDIKGTLSFDKAKYIIDLWASEGLKNIRFSGGEPTLYSNLLKLVKYTKYKGVERIAISTNGSANTNFYKELISSGVDDFSFSLDACCSSFGEKMSGVKNTWDHVVKNIEAISKLAYVTVGVVITEENASELEKIIMFADSLGVSDIRIISAAQFQSGLNINILKGVKTISKDTLNKYPILKYRVNNVIKNKNVRGMSPTDANQCKLVLDDMAIGGNFHFPCIIYLRQYGDPIGKIGNNMRKERYNWYMNHDTFADPICRETCLDVCIDYNNKSEKFNKNKQ
jgi:molybdenum cofactor biosynthesis enzyme MoaA